MKAFLAVLAALLALLLPPAARADLHDAVNWARVRGCRSAASLRGNHQLDVAAARMANGKSLRAALGSAGYFAAQSAAVHLSGAVSDADVSRILASDYCATLTDPKMTEMGGQRRAHDVWLVFAAPAPLPSTADAAPIGRQILRLVNAARARGRRCGAKAYPPAAPLALNAALMHAALAHSQEMATDAVFDHRGRGGSSPAARVERAGYGGYRIVGENIAAGAMTPVDVMQGWLASPAHCENIMDPRFSDVGIAFAVNLGSPELVYWTQDFAAPSR